MNLWIARNEDKELFLYGEKPTRRIPVLNAHDHYWTVSTICYYRLTDVNIDITWEDGPVEVELVKKEELVMMRCCGNCKHYDRTVCDGCNDNKEKWQPRQMRGNKYDRLYGASNEIND